MEATKLCSNCEQNIPESKFILHERFCATNVKKCPICKEIINIEDEQEHIAEYHTEVPCTFCKRNFAKEKVEDHQKVCDEQMVRCQYCELDVTKKERNNHEYVCGSKTEKCFSCDEYIQIKDMAQHISRGCKLKEVKKEREVIPPKKNLYDNLFKEEKNPLPIKGTSNKQYGVKNDKNNDANWEQWLDNDPYQINAHANDNVNIYGHAYDNKPLSSNNMQPYPDSSSNKNKQPVHTKPKEKKEIKSTMIDKTNNNNAAERKKYDQIPSYASSGIGSNAKDKYQRQPLNNNKEPMSAIKSSQVQAIEEDYRKKYDKQKQINEDEYNKKYTKKYIPPSSSQKPNNNANPYNNNMNDKQKEINKPIDNYPNKKTNPYDYTEKQIPVKDEKKPTNSYTKPKLEAKPAIKPSMTSKPDNSMKNKPKPQQTHIKKAETVPIAKKEQPKSYADKYQDDYLPDDVMDFNTNTNFYHDPQYLTTEEKEFNAVIEQSLKYK